MSKCVVLYANDNDTIEPYQGLIDYINSKVRDPNTKKIERRTFRRLGKRLREDDTTFVVFRNKDARNHAARIAVGSRTLWLAVSAELP